MPDPKIEQRRRRPQKEASPPFKNIQTEGIFLDWYGRIASQLGLDPNPDNPLHFYDYRRAFAAGVQPDPVSLHFPSDFKLVGHPNRFVDGRDTITGEPVTARAILKNDKRYARVSGIRRR